MVKKETLITRENNYDKFISHCKICSPFFLALPNPPGNLVKTLNKLFYKFIWNSGPDRIKRQYIIKDTTKEGQRMIKIDSFVTALKVTWFRRQIQTD